MDISHKDLVEEYRVLLASTGNAMLWAVVDIWQTDKVDGCELYFVVTTFPDQKTVLPVLSEAIEFYNEVG